MSRWKQWVRPPEGALPGGIVTKAGVVLIAVLVGGLLFSWAMTGPQEDATALGFLPEAQAVDDGMGRSLQAAFGKRPSGRLWRPPPGRAPSSNAGRPRPPRRWLGSRPSRRRRTPQP